MAKLNIPTGGEGGGSKKKFVLPGGEVGEAKGKLVVPGAEPVAAAPVEEVVPPAIPDASEFGEFGEVEPSAGDDFLILEEEPREGGHVEPVQVAAMSAPEPEVYVEEVLEPEPVAEVKPVKISSMVPPVAEGDEPAAVASEEIVYEEPVAAAEPIVIPAEGAPRLVVPPVESVAPPLHAPPHAPPVEQHAPPPPPASAAGYGYPVQGGMPPGGVPGAEGHSTLLQQTGYLPTPQRSVPGWALMLVGILMGMVITILAVKFSPLGEMLVGPVMTLDEVGYE